MSTLQVSQDAAAAEKSAHELEGPAGLKMTGGDLTPRQNAGEVLANIIDGRRGEQRMEGRQMAGGVEQQTQSHSPSASNPDGLPNPIHGHAVEDFVTE